MKIHITLPGVDISIEREPMEPYKFYAAVWAACITIVLCAFFSIFK